MTIVHKGAISKEQLQFRPFFSIRHESQSRGRAQVACTRSTIAESRGSRWEHQPLRRTQPASTGSGIGDLVT
jgi:hypothetical protein